MIKPVHNSNELQVSSLLDRSNPEFSTNNFLSIEQIEDYISRDLLFFDSNSSANLIFRKTEFNYRLYFSASRLFDLREVLADIKLPLPISVDLIRRLEGESPALEIFLEAGFLHKATLKRMTLAQSVGARLPKYRNEAVRVARESDIDSIHHLLHINFDSIVEQLPDLTEVRRYVESQNALVVDGNNDICGLLIQTRDGKVAHLKHWIVAESHQNTGIGMGLFSRFISDNNVVNRYDLWVLSDNQKVIEIYERIGFKFDGLIDEVLITQERS
jgi:ribosomal protein S18 acetylase RimI-like enzyme